MRGSRFHSLAACVAIAVFITTSIACAENFSSVVVYGDSLSDNGNLYAVSGYPPAPYYNGHFSNGPVAVEQLASQYGVPIYDFAYGGATTGLGNYIDGGSRSTTGGYGLPGMQIEVGATTALVPSLAASNALFVVWGGANDFLTGDSAADAASDIAALVAQLQSYGAKNILVPGMPDLGLTPDFYGYALATAYAQAFNAALLADLPSGAVYVDTFDLMRDIVADPSAYGLTDVTDPCFNKALATVCSDPSKYLFWDGLHPTTTADAILAKEFAEAEVPEPSVFVFLGTGLLGMLVLRVRRVRISTAVS